MLSLWSICAIPFDDYSTPDDDDPDDGESMPALTEEQKEWNKEVAEFLDSDDKEFIDNFVPSEEDMERSARTNQAYREWRRSRFEVMNLKTAEKTKSRTVHDWQIRLTARTNKETILEFLDGYEFNDGRLNVPAGVRLTLKVHVNRSRAVLLCSKNKHASMWFMKRAENISAENTWIDTFPTLDELVDLIFNPDLQSHQTQVSGLHYPIDPLFRIPLVD